MNIKIPDILIVGAGPAGITAAIQLKRYGLRPTLLEKDAIGGLLRNANLVENYPGFPKGIPGRKLIALFDQQIQRFGVDVVYEEVMHVGYHHRWQAETSHNTYQPDIVVLASGTKSRPFPLVIPDQIQGKVFSEVWPLADVRDKHIAIVGAGDAAFDFALNLSRKNKVTILNRDSETRCLPLLEERVRDNSRIAYLSGVTVTALTNIESGDGLRVTCAGEVPASVDCDYIIYAIGRDQQLDFLEESVKLQESTLLESGRLYLAGDVHNGLFRQTAIAVGEGMRTAMQIYANRGVR